MGYWFNTATSEIAESDMSPWNANDSMGPYDSAQEARAAYAVSDARNAEADIAEENWEAADEWDKEDREWKKDW